MLRRIVRVVTASCLLLLLIGAAHPADRVFRCRYDHVARPACCCPDSAMSNGTTQTAAAGQREAASTPCCCDIETYRLVQGGPQTHPRVETPATQVMTLSPVGGDVLPAYTLTPACVDLRARNGPPIVVLNHSYRI